MPRCSTTFVRWSETRGDPHAPLLWTAKSLRKLAAGLQALGHRIGHNVVGDLLRGMGYSLQANRKTLEGSHHPSVDTKKKELVGDLKTAGREYPGGLPDRWRTEPIQIREHRSRRNQLPFSSVVSKTGLPAGPIRGPIPA